MEFAEVVVIGAGAAGLAAFQRLRAAGCDAVLLEARGRVGGRIHTLRPEDWPLPVELGAEFIHGPAPELAGADGEEGPRDTRSWIARNGGVHLAAAWRRPECQRASLAGERSAPTKRPKGSDQANSSEPRAEEWAGGADAVFERMREIVPPEPDCSFAEFLDVCGDLPEVARRGALAYIEGYEAADPGRISVHALNREQQVEEQSDGDWPRRPRGGYGAVLDGLRAEGKVCLGARVQRVRWRAGEVEIEAEQAGKPLRYHARRAILTLPLAVLQADRVGFDPPLPAAKRSALARLAMGPALRVTLRLREPVWRGLRDSDDEPMDTLGFLFGPEEESGHFPTWWASEAEGTAQITGWAGGRHAASLSAYPPEWLRDRALRDLAARLRLPPEALARQVLAAHSHNWQADEFALGAYSYATVGGADAFAVLAEPLGAALFFAGEATDATGQHATVQGALRSGRRAADEALAAGI